eukprot:scaffold232859_cov36-Tisochrysis_lutea.AAC.1
MWTARRVEQDKPGQISTSASSHVCAKPRDCVPFQVLESRIRRENVAGTATAATTGSTRLISRVGRGARLPRTRLLAGRASIPAPTTGGPIGIATSIRAVAGRRATSVPNAVPAWIPRTKAAAKGITKSARSTADENWLSIHVHDLWPRLAEEPREEVARIRVGESTIPSCEAARAPIPRAAVVAACVPVASLLAIAGRVGPGRSSCGLWLGARCGAALEGVESRLTHRIVYLTQLLIREHLVRAARSHKAALRRLFLVFGATHLVWMVLEGDLAVGALERLAVCVARHAEEAVKVLLARGA